MSLMDFFGSYYLVSCVTAWITSVLLKAYIESKRTKVNYNIKLGFTNGGMPSTHVVWVTCITIAVGLTTGMSALFFVALIFAYVVVVDAFGVRRNVGLQGDALNEVRKKLRLKQTQVIHGHTIAQVIAGIIWGAGFAVLFYLLYF